MTTVIDAIWQQTEPHVFITREEWERGLEGWKIDPGERDGVLAFAILTRGPEFHFTVFGDQPPFIWFGPLREHVETLIDRYGFVRTRTPKEPARQHRLMKTLGFVAEGEDEFFINYRMDVPAWRDKCPSSP